MPLVPSTYRPPFLFRSAHYATVWCGLYRKVEVQQIRERITLPDGDFLDLDWSYSLKQGRQTEASGQPELSGRAESRPTQRPGKSGSISSVNPLTPVPTGRQALGVTPSTVDFQRSTRAHQAAILLHGLEGHAQRPYMTGNARWLNQNGIDTCAVNFRGCSGETNTLYRSYHSGATEDLDAVVQHVVAKGYEQVYLVGISLGGNMLLKYLGEDRDIPEHVQAGMAIAAPCDLYASLQCIMSFQNSLYARRFKNHLVEKLYRKQKLYPEKLSDSTIKEIKTLKDFDDLYTSKAHGFADAMDYYTQCSSKQFLPTLKRPALIINSKDDTFLKEGCYPVEEAKKFSNVFLEIPKYGGHVGFVGSDNVSYSERRVLEFIQEISMW